MLLDATTDSLDVILDKAVTANNVTFGVFYNEYTSTSVTPKKNIGGATGAAAVNLIPSPTSTGMQRQLRWCSIFNSDTSDIGVTVRFNDNSNLRNVLNVFLRVGETIQYSEKTGWRIYDYEGNEKVSGYNKIPGTIRMPEWFGANGIGTTLATVSGTAYCVYLGRADRSFSSVRLLYRVTSTLVTPTWAEVAIYVGAPTLQVGTSMSRRGSTSTSTAWQSGGQKLTSVNTTGIAIGDDLWAVFANSASTGVTLRAGAVDDVGNGHFQTSAATQPSVTQTITGTVNSTSAMIWVAWQGAPKSP